MSDDPSPWPERRRTQHALFGAGGVLLAVVALALVGAVPLGGAHVVMLATVASGLLVYGLLGWAGRWVADGEDAAEDAVAGGDTGVAGGARAVEGTDGDGDTTADGDTDAGGTGTVEDRDDPGGTGGGKDGADGTAEEEGGGGGDGSGGD